MVIRIGAAALAFFLATSSAYADEQMQPLAVNGDWIALAHSASVIAPPDVCMAMNIRSGVAVRAGTDGFQFRMMDQTWSLPARITGTLKISSGQYSKTFDIDFNTDTMVSSDVTLDDIRPLLEMMDKSSSMTVVPGSGKPVAVSLAGSSRVLTAFRTCAGIRGGDTGRGGNPFGQ